MKTFILWILLGGTAAAETCKEHRDMVRANFLVQNWKEVGQSGDDDFLSVTFKKPEGEFMLMTTFFYSAHPLLIAEAEAKNFQPLDANCVMGSQVGQIYYLTSKRRVKA